MNDEMLDTAYRAFCESRMGRELTDGEFKALRSRTEMKWLRAALEAVTR